MGHHIQGFIAPLPDLRIAIQSWPHAKIAPLAQNFGFLPLSEEMTHVNDPCSPLDFTYLTAPMEEWALVHSHLTPIVYLETCYTGGPGDQAAVLWGRGKRIWGPLKTDDDDPNGVPDLSANAINQCLRLMGISKLDQIDEFAALGLGRHRSNESWLQIAT